MSCIKTFQRNILIGRVYYNTCLIWTNDNDTTQDFHLCQNFIFLDVILLLKKTKWRQCSVPQFIFSLESGDTDVLEENIFTSVCWISLLAESGSRSLHDCFSYREAVLMRGDCETGEGPPQQPQLHQLIFFNYLKSLSFPIWGLHGCLEE